MDKLCQLSDNLRISDLPYLNRYMEVREGGRRVNKLCYKGVLGKCTWPECIRKHPPKNELDNGFIDKLNEVLKKGRTEMCKPTYNFQGHKRKRE